MAFLVGCSDLINLIRSTNHRVGKYRIGTVNLNKYMLFKIADKKELSGYFWEKTFI